MTVDPRAPRFAAAITSAVLIVVLITGSGWLALAQAVVFAVAAVSLRHAPYPLVYRTLIAPRLAAPVEREPAEPVRFSQLVGFVFMAPAAPGYLLGAPVVGLVCTGLALVAAFLNAAFGYCLGCETYLLLRRLTARA
jgi:hypothetical protein